MARKPIPLRLDEKQLDRLAAIAAKLQVSKTSIIEAALDVRLDLLEGYVKLDTAPPKTVKAKGGLRKASLVPGGIVYADGLHDAAVVAGRMKAEALVRTQPKVKHLKPNDDITKNLGQTRSVRGYAIDGTPLYR